MRRAGTMKGGFEVLYRGQGSFRRADGAGNDRGWYVIKSMGVPLGPYGTASDAYSAARSPSGVHLTNPPTCHCGERHCWGETCPGGRDGHDMDR